MRPDPTYAASLPASSTPHEPVVIVGYHAAFATHPRTGTVLATFAEFSFGCANVAVGTALMGLVRIEHATEYSVADPDGSLRIEWRDAMFSCLPRGISWLLVPAELDAETGRARIAPGWWAAGRHQAQLPHAVTDHILEAPTVVNVHDQDPHTGRRWPQSC